MRIKQGVEEINGITITGVSKMIDTFLSSKILTVDSALFNAKNYIQAIYILTSALFSR